MTSLLEGARRWSAPTYAKLADLLHRLASARDQNNGISFPIGSGILTSVDVASEPPTFRGVMCRRACLFCESPTRHRGAEKLILNESNKKIAKH